MMGLGSRGFNLLYAFLREPNAQVVAVCDVDRQHYRDNPWGEGTAYGAKPAQEAVMRYLRNENGGGLSPDIAVYKDYRELCARDDIDAVVVATPDHWHALCSLEALKQGKDVYCEKPVTHLFAEGQLLYREATARKAVFQGGSQQRSEGPFRRAVDLVLNGCIGQVRRVEVGLPMGYDKPMGDPTVQTPPEHLDYGFWCGPGPELPYMRARHHRWWRGHRAYGGGVLMDWIGHHNDIAHWALGMDNSGPLKVEAVDWDFPATDIYNTPQHYTIRCEYAGGIESIISSRNKNGTKWIGDEGWIHVDRAKLSASGERLTAPEFDPGPLKARRSPGHVKDFVTCCASREPCIAPAETAHRSVTPGHLAYVSHAVGRALNWDPAKEQIVDDEEANALLREDSLPRALVTGRLTHHQLQGAGRTAGEHFAV